MKTEFKGQILKMETEALSPVKYSLPVGGEKISMNPLLSKKFTIEFNGIITCIHCSRKIKKTFGQGYCFPCFQTLARCDMCIMRPELCHYHKGTCREPEWGEKHCLIPHTVYIANSSGAKVGITRKHQQKTRWMDQGALFVMPIGEVNSRLESGQIESVLKDHISDRTNWRNMLKNEVPEVNFSEIKQSLVKHWPDNLQQSILEKEEIFEFTYPVNEYPTKVVSHNLDKKILLEGTLMGIKGQYLLFDTAVINMRKYAGYELSISWVD